MADHSGIIGLSWITSGSAALVFLLFAAYAIGFVIGVVLAVSRASVIEDRRFTLTGSPPGPLALGARTFLHAGSLGSGFVSEGRRLDDDQDRPKPGDGAATGKGGSS